MQQEMMRFLSQALEAGTLPDELQERALELFAGLSRGWRKGGVNHNLSGGSPLAQIAGHSLVGSAAATAVPPRTLLYVHGICSHTSGFSDGWWGSLHPFVPTLFGDGTLGITRIEVLWSDLVNQAGSPTGPSVAPSLLPGFASSALHDAPQSVSASATVLGIDVERRRVVNEIREALRDRADQVELNASFHADGFSSGASPSSIPGSMSIPGANCIDDFSIYLVKDAVRQQILDRFLDQTRPLLQAGGVVDIISHSWGTVVAYEGLRQLEDEGFVNPLVHRFFTVGSALSIGPVKSRLRDANRDGHKPANVSRWINLDARGDIVGGPLKNRPFAVDEDYINLEASGCGSFLTLVNPSCAHGSYFSSANDTVNRDIFAAQIMSL